MLWLLNLKSRAQLVWSAGRGYKRVTQFNARQIKLMTQYQHFHPAIIPYNHPKKKKRVAPLLVFYLAPICAYTHSQNHTQIILIRMFEYDPKGGGKHQMCKARNNPSQDQIHWSTLTQPAAHNCLFKLEDQSFSKAALDDRKNL